MSSRLLISQLKNIASATASLQMAAASFPSSSIMSHSAIFPLKFASRWAIARPKPRAAPVMIAVSLGLSLSPVIFFNPRRFLDPVQSGLNQS